MAGEDVEPVGEGADLPSPTDNSAPTPAQPPSPPIDEATAALLDFLQKVPPEVRAWLNQQAERSGRPLGGAAGSDAVAHLLAGSDQGNDESNEETDGPAEGDRTTPTQGTASGTDPDEELDPDLLDEDDDILTQRRRPTLVRVRTGATNAPGQRRGLSSRWGIVLIAVALVVGVCFGVWFAGRPAAGPAASTNPTLSSADDTAGSAARIAELETVLAANQDDADANLELGVLLFNQGDIEAASQHWLTVTLVAPDQVQAWYNLGFYYLSREPADFDAARQAWEKVIELEPDSDLAATVSTHIDGLMTTPSAPSEPSAAASTSGS